jgi:hypothetical protein
VNASYGEMFQDRPELALDVLEIEDSRHSPIWQPARDDQTIEVGVEAASASGNRAKDHERDEAETVVFPRRLQQGILKLGEGLTELAHQSSIARSNPKPTACHAGVQSEPTFPIACSRGTTRRPLFEQPLGCCRDEPRGRAAHSLESSRRGSYALDSRSSQARSRRLLGKIGRRSARAARASRVMNCAMFHGSTGLGRCGKDVLEMSRVALVASGSLWFSGCSEAKTADDATPDEPGQGDAGPTEPGPGPGPNEPVQVLRAWDWAGIVGTGQSLSVGAEGNPVGSTDQPYDNLKLALGALGEPPFDAQSEELEVVPLVEPLRAFATSYPSAYPRNLYGETPHTAMANQISALVEAASGEGYVTVHTAVGESGQPMSVINKTATDTGTMGRAYAATLFEAQALGRLAEEEGLSYGVGAIFITHGESDAGSSTYDDALVQLWSDYNADLMALTGQTQSIPLFVSQQHSVPDAQGMTSASTRAQWLVGVDNPGDIVCTGPKYQYPYAPDHIHLTALGYRLLGEKYGQIYFEKVVLGRDWQPLQPLEATVAGNVITVRFQVPVQPLVWDESMAPPHQSVLIEWAQGRGFEVTVAAAPVTIEGVEFVGDDSVAITVDRDLAASTVIVAYAHTADGANLPGGTSRWGQLRDSDPFVGSTTGTAQPNYSVAFSMLAR